MLSYSRRKLLLIADRCKKAGFKAPADLVPLESWFGYVDSILCG